MIKIDKSVLCQLNALISELYESAQKGEDATYYAADELSAILDNCYSDKAQ